MKRRTILKMLPFVVAAGYAQLDAKAKFKTKWSITGQQGLDACLLFGLLSTPSFQSEAYPKESQEWRQRLSPLAMEAIARLRAASDIQGGLLGPQLALIASAAPSDTLDKTINAFANSDIIKKGLQQSTFWSGEKEWQSIASLFPDILIVLRQLAEKGFESYWQIEKLPKINLKAKILTEELSSIDLIGTQQLYIARQLEPNIDIYLSAFSEPHGIRIVGQRFLTSYDYPSSIVKQNAAHEIFHPTLSSNRPETKLILSRLSRDPLLNKINARKNKSDGYGSIEGLIEEGIVQALEAVVSKKLGFGRSDIGAYWQEQDAGIHVFAAAVFHAMYKTGFAFRGGDSLKWLSKQVSNANLTGENLISHATAIIGNEAVQKWLR